LLVLGDHRAFQLVECELRRVRQRDGDLAFEHEEDERRRLFDATDRLELFVLFEAERHGHLHLFSRVQSVLVSCEEVELPQRHDEVCDVLFGSARRSNPAYPLKVLMVRDYLDLTGQELELCELVALQVDDDQVRRCDLLHPARQVVHRLCR